MTGGPYRTQTGIGAKDGEGPATSSDAAAAHAIALRRIREAVFDVIRRAAEDGLTADEAAALLNMDVLSVRPRISELKAQGRVRATGARRNNVKGNSQAVVAAAEYAPATEDSPGDDRGDDRGDDQGGGPDAGEPGAPVQGALL